MDPLLPSVLEQFKLTAFGVTSTAQADGNHFAAPEEVLGKKLEEPGQQPCQVSASSPQCQFS